MDPIATFAEVLMDLNDKEIVYTVSRGAITYFFLKDGLIHVKNPLVHYPIALDQFKELFSKEIFYLYTDRQELIDETKDADYYAWKNRGTN